MFLTMKFGPLPRWVQTPKSTEPAEIATRNAFKVRILVGEEGNANGGRRDRAIEDFVAVGDDGGLTGGPHIGRHRTFRGNIQFAAFLHLGWDGLGVGGVRQVKPPPDVAARRTI